MIKLEGKSVVNEKVQEGQTRVAFRIANPLGFIGYNFNNNDLKPGDIYKIAKEVYQEKVIEILIVVGQKDGISQEFSTPLSRRPKMLTKFKNMILYALTVATAEACVCGFGNTYEILRSLQTQVSPHK